MGIWAIIFACNKFWHKEVKQTTQDHTDSNGACIQTQVSVTTIECNSFKFFWVQNGQREGKRKEVKF